MRVRSYGGRHGERFARVVRVRDGEHQIHERIELAVRADAERDAGVSDRAKWLVLRAAMRSESSAHSLVAIGEVTRVLDDDHTQLLRPAPQISREPLRMLHPGPQPSPHRVRRE
jgi:hypothetical protein